MSRSGLRDPERKKGEKTIKPTPVAYTAYMQKKKGKEGRRRKQNIHSVKTAPHHCHDTQHHLKKININTK